MTRRAIAGRVAALGGAAALLTACGYHGVSSLPLPGAIGGSGTHQVTVVLADATNLVPQETCRANDTIVGSVSSITLGPDLRARATCAIEDSVRLPANTVATVAETSLLGERYVSLDPPPGSAPTGALPSGAVIPFGVNRTAPDTEEVLGSLSMVLNGGNLRAVHTITAETNQALAGHETDIRSLIDQLTTLTGQLDARRGDITASLDAVDRLSTTLARQREVLGRALDTVPGGLQVLNRHREQVVTLLRRLSELSRTATPVLRDSTADTVADLRHLDPILTALARNGRQIAPALELLSFPVPRNGLNAVKGDFVGSHFTIHLDLDTLNNLLAQEAQAPPSNRGRASEPPPPPPVNSAPAPPPLPPPGDLLDGGHR
jgi:phospholipid/cholesterol/gamma-HCH transport system substrate-binding protein